MNSCPPSLVPSVSEHFAHSVRVFFAGLPDGDTGSYVLSRLFILAIFENKLS